MVTFSTPTDAYLESLRSLIYSPEYRTSPRGKPIREILHAVFKVDAPSEEPVQTLDEERNAKIAAYTKAELELYATGSNKASDFMKLSKFWGPLANPDGTINSAYGYLLFKDESCGSLPCTPWAWAKDSLIEDRDTRQAILKFHKREHLWHGNKDQVCTLSGTFHIREDRLHFAIHMRSNDVMYGMPYDLAYFCSLQKQMLAELLPTYPSLKLGHYVHHVDSLHLYEKDLVAAYKMVGHTVQEELALL